MPLGFLQVNTCNRMLQTATFASALSLLRGDIIGSATYARRAMRLRQAQQNTPHAFEDVQMV